MDNSKIRGGLNDKEVLDSRKKYGSNKLANAHKNSFFSLLLESFGDPIIKILLIVLAVKTVFLFQSFDWFETLGIVIAITLASLISTISEYGSEKSFEKLQEETSNIKSRVVRNGDLIEIPINEIVVGDIVNISGGDFIPADGFLLENRVIVDESSFSGETEDKEKIRGDKLYRGSVVLSGNAYIEIKSVGSNTKYGKIAQDLTNKNPNSPLKNRLKKLAHTISKIGYLGAILVMISYLFSVIFIANNFNLSEIISLITNYKVLFGHIIYALTLGVTIIIVSVPEGLPMMIALVLSSNMQKMIKNNVMVRRMVGIETAGCLDTLLSDKTGTITKGKMEVKGFICGDGKIITSKEQLSKYPSLFKSIIKNIVINNECVINKDGKVIGGNNTDRALIKYVGETNFHYNKLAQVFFDSSKKYSSVTIDDGGVCEYIKGAAENILPKIKYYTSLSGTNSIIDKSLIEKELTKYTKKGFRVILLAEKKSSDKDYVFQSLVLLKDEISESAIDAIKIIEEAGVNTIMITGDSKETATNIAEEIGLLKGPRDIILTSDELKVMSDVAIGKIYNDIKVIARALPEDKSRLVKIAQQLNKVVGMTGDGVNDAPALKMADVGFAMGSGSEVSKEASDIIILDNNLLSISKSILYGRTIFKSIRKFIIFQLTMNICALSLSIIGPFIGINTPVTVMQMLWINMIMDTFAGLAFSFEAPLKDYMKEKPIDKNEPILNKYMYSSIVATGLYSSLLLILFLKIGFIKNMFRIDPNDKYLMTGFFALFVFSGVFNAFNSRTERKNIFKNILNNKPFLLITAFIMIMQILLIYKGGNIFRTYGLTLKELLFVMLLSVTVIPFDIVRKYLYNKHLIKFKKKIHY